MIQIDDIIINLQGNDFLEPYLQRAFGHGGDDEEAQPRPRTLPTPTMAVSIRSDVLPHGDDRDFDAICRDCNLPLLSLYCPIIIGTGMVGLPRRMAAGIYRGSYFSIVGNESRLSAIHAADLADAVALAAGTDGSFTITDGVDHKLDDLAEALAYRLGDKRIYAIKPWMARLWYGKEYYSQLTADHLASDSFAQAYPSFSPTPVTQYLRTHVYDEKSL